MINYDAIIRRIEERLSEAEADLRTLKDLRTLEAGKGEDDLPTPPHPRWKPSGGESYYVLLGNGHTYTLRWSLSKLEGDITDNECYSDGNVFRTEEEAENVAVHRKVLAEMQEWAGNWNDPWRIIYIDGRVEPETVFVGRCISYGELRFKSEADAINCIKAVGEDRLKKYYFCVPEVHECCTSES